MSKKAPKKKALWRRALIIARKIIVDFIVISIIIVLFFRLVPALTSGVMIQRAIEAAIAGEQDVKRAHQWVRWSAISDFAPLAVIASEDQRFYQHYGFDLQQIDKALQAKRHGGRLRGASTITQQTAKNLFLWNGRSFVRKGFEAWFTVLMELLWPKQRILEMYLNIVEFGPGIYGIEAASQYYFNKPAKQLGRYEAALLAAVLPNPHRLHADKPSPYVRERQQWIIRQMRQLGGTALIDVKLN